MTGDPHAASGTTARASAALDSAAPDFAATITGCLMFILVMFLPPVLNDGDTLWQITTGAWILDHHAIPATDPFSFATAGRPWFAHEWLAETLMGATYRLAGLRGIMVLAAAAIGLTAAILLHHLRRFLPGIYAATATIVALSTAAPSMLARPHVLAWPCLAAWCAGLAAVHARRVAPPWSLLAVMLVWVNLHGSFMVGLLLPGAFMIEALWDPGANRRHVLLTWSRFIAAAWMVALVNPDGLGGLLFPIHMIGMQSLVWIGEWQPPAFSQSPPLELIILGALALGLSGRLKLPPVRLILFLGLVYAALSHGRNGQLLGIVGVLILAEPLGASLGRGAAKPLVRAWRHLSRAAAILAVAALPLRIAVPLDPDRSGAAFAATLGAVPPALRARPVLNEYGFGGQLIFAGIKPFIDSRADLYGDAFLMRYHRMAATDRGELDRTLSQYGIAWTIFPVSHPLVAVMDERTGWRRLVDTNGIVIHARDTEAPR